MLKSTFRHFRGIGVKSERNFWLNGIVDWRQYNTVSKKNNNVIEINESIKAYKERNIQYFANQLVPADYWRIAVSFPQRIIFLDIETTGLSLYYDQITLVGWSVGTDYRVYIHGNDTADCLKDALTQSEIIVTFNGIMFDLKFLTQTFSNLSLPPVHIDLRYLAKRVGLSGGQKSIEKQIGVCRNHEIQNMRGENAPVLWHQYKHGNKNALRKLITYNHADVEGMKAILDTAVNAMYRRENIPERVCIYPHFSKKTSNIDWTTGKRRGANGICVETFRGQTKPLATYCTLNTRRLLDTFCVVGIDLVSSEDRETGCCVLRGDRAKTYRLKTDEALIRIAIENKAHLVSIDSPLSIPEGRVSISDDSPCREKYGITRVCEKVLRKRGIGVYPCLIPSMQKLTKRGMELAEKFRKSGISVIESYPGAAQDIMRIPRKQAGLQYLTEGLKEFGIKGTYTKARVSHDELDAITSAIVGQFYQVGMYEEIGNKTEGYLIIPYLTTPSL